MKKRSVGYQPDFPELLSHHDVVFRAPTHDPIYGLPIGNGDSGCLIWTEPDRLHISINKTNLWDDAYSIEEICCEMELENQTVCRHGAHLTIQFGCPVFEMLYQNKYEGRLSLYDGTARISADTPFCKADLTAFSSEQADVSVIHGELNFDEAMPLDVSLQRWGSRTMQYWYSVYKPGTHFGLDGTSSDCSDGIMKIVQKLNGTTFCVAVLPVCEKEPALSVAGSHGVRGAIEPGSHHEMTLMIVVATGSDGQDAVKNAVAKLQCAAATGYEALYREHARRWAEFWSKSYVCLPEQNDFQENLWYLNLYYANSQMKGKSPAHFCNGIWNFYHDFVPWTFFFHYNMQHAAYPLEAANHPELLETYFNYRIEQLPYAKLYAQKYKNAQGAFYADVCDRYGRNAPNVSENCTCGAQIAMMLYKRYLYSGDRDYLLQKALPVMEETALFYLDILTLGEDGYYHTCNTSGYEGSPLFDDSITDHVMIRALFGALIDVLPEEKSAPYRERLEKLAPFRYTDMYADEVENGVFTRGIGKGEAVRGERVLAVGREPGKDKLIRRTFGNAAHDYYGFPDTEMSPLFPAGIVGIKDRGTDIYNAIYNSVCLHHPTLMEGNALGRDPGDGVCMGWCMEPIYLARMGMSELLQTHMENTITTWMLLPQGFGYYTPTDNSHLKNRWNHYRVYRGETEEIRQVQTWNFRHFDYETLPIIATTTNEMLLQSYDGTVRLFCAVLPTESYAFSLMAQGGFEVRAVYAQGQFEAWILSNRGGILKLAVENVTGDFDVFDAQGNTISTCPSGETCRIDTVPGIAIHVGNTKGLVFERLYTPNTTAKVFGDAKLGEFPAID